MRRRLCKKKRKRKSKRGNETNVKRCARLKSLGGENDNVWSKLGESLTNLTFRATKPSMLSEDNIDLTDTESLIPATGAAATPPGR